MKEFKRILDYFNWEYYKMFSEKSIEFDYEVAKNFLYKYGITDKEYFSNKKNIQNKQFINSEKGFSENIFPANYHLIPLNGIVSFTEEEYNVFRYFLQELGETHFVMIQNVWNQEETYPPLRFKFPASTTWEELMSGNYLSTILFEMPDNEYFFFGENPNWGRYCENNWYITSIFGYTSEIEPLVLKEYKSLIENNWRTGLTYSPEIYKEHLQQIAKKYFPDRRES